MGQFFPDPRHELESPVQLRVIDRIAEVVAAMPAGTAILRGTSSWTYAELDRAAQGFAAALRALGIERGQVVGICGEPVFGLISSLLGAMRAGAVLLPIDPRLPTARQQWMLEQAGAQVLAVVGDVDCDVDALAANRIRLSIDGTSGAVTTSADPRRAGQAPKAARRLPDDAAYLFFTSGTTGTPKGVIGSHRGLAHFIHWQREQFGIGPADRVAQVTGLSFDVVLRELFLPLTSGAALCLPEQPVDDPRALWPWLDRQGITVLHGVPSRLRGWLSHVPAGASPRSLRWLFMAGEPLSHTLVEAWRAVFPGEVINLYGPTETTLAKSWYAVPAGAALEPGIQPIGRPLPQTQLLVLGENDRLCGVGEPGEIVIRTPFASLGYLDAEQTRARFVQNPFRDDPDDVLYRTGDLGRYRPDGLLEIRGRLDDQLKIGGVRIEPAEVAGQLSAHVHVAACHVGAVVDAQGEPRLVAWVAPVPGQALTASELQKFLAARLPGAMVPSRFVVLDHLPLTPNGKVDRQALPPPDDSRPQLETGYVAPRTALEQQLALIWDEVLDLEGAGIHDDFFALGGHSLLAARVNARIAAAFEVELPLRTLFEAPTIAQLAAAIETLREGGGNRTGPPLRRVDRQGLERPPLSFAQQRLWLLDRMEGGLTAYNMAYALKLEGQLDVDALRRSLEEVVRRHEVLRTTFVMQGEEPVQVIHPAGRFELPCEDLSGLAPEQAAAAITARASQAAQQPFDLSRDTMLRALLLRRAEDQHALLIAMHHIASDGWSVGVLLRELSALYAAFRDGKPSPLPELPLQYLDFSVWQRECLQGDSEQRLLDYWREQLRDLPASLDLPADHPRPPQITYRGARHTFALPTQLATQLKSLSQEAGATLHMVLLAAFQTLLMRYSGEEDIAVGTPVAGRNHPEIEGLIGFFVNTLVMRGNLGGNPAFSELLARTRDYALGAYAHQELPFEKLVEALRPERDMSRNPLFQVMFVLQNTPESDLRLAGLDAQRLPLHSATAKFDLSLSLTESHGHLLGSLEYSTDLFDLSRIQRLAQHYQCLLESIANNPRAPIWELPFLPQAERLQLLVSWNDTVTDYPRDQCVHALFEAWVERTPGAVAVILEDRQLTYRELNARANQLAHYLRSLGVKPEVPVGLCLQRSLEWVIATLAILKAGGAYVPLDPDYPQERLDFMLRDTHAAVVLTQSTLQQRLPASNAHLLCLDADAALWSAQPDSDPTAVATPDSLAYVMYTSGSTGLPKGVEVHHGNIVRLVCGASYVRLDASRTFLLLAPIAFDASTFELWGALLHGARCVIYPARLPTPLSLGETLQRHRVDTLWLTASLFNLVVDEKPEILRGVSQLLTGGEALSPPHVQRALALLPNTQLINGYGPTESTTFACCYPIPHDLTEECGSVPIGRPISNTLCHVLDAHGNLTPIGVPGELYIGGAGLARGYLNRPELTAERFVPSPFRPGERLYRTGDQVRWREDGVLEFLGRIDHQIKLRGYRIEPGEIEAVLQQDEAIQQSLVLPREDRPGDMRLVAYLVGQGIEVDTVRARLKAHLPDYMIPAAFVVLDHLPLTPNGKVDRQALPPPDDSRPQLESGYVAPRSHIEATLAEIWANTLNLPRVGIFDNYFALGGHSLLAVRLMERIQQSIGRTLHLNTLWYQAGNIAQQAHLLTDQSESSASSKSVLLLRQGGNVPALFCLHTIGGGNLFHYEPLIRYLNSDRPVYGLQAKGIDRNEKPDTTIEAMAEYCIQSMRAIQPNGPYLLCGFSSGGLLAFEMARLLENEGIETKLFMVDTFLPNQPRSFWRRLNGWLNLVKPDHFRDLQERIYHSFLSSLGLSHLRSLRGLGESHRWAMWSYHPQASGLSADYFEASERANNQPRPSAGWASFLNGGITIHMIPGTHGTMVKHNNALVLAKKISACLS